MPQFNGFGGLAAQMWRASRMVQPAIDAELHIQGTAIANSAKALFGTYQAGWRQLAESTQKDRQRRGYSPNDPLLRSGALQGLVKPYVAHGALFVGVMSGTSVGKVDAALLMAVHELGRTDKSISARPVFGIIKGKIDNQIHAFTLGVAVRVLG